MTEREHSKCLYRNTAGSAPAARGLGAPFRSQRHRRIRQALKAESHPPCSSPKPSSASRKHHPSRSSTDPTLTPSHQQQPQLRPRSCPHPPRCHRRGEPVTHTVLLSLHIPLRFVALGLPKQEVMPPECPEIGPKHVGQGEDTLSENISAGCFEKGLGTWPLPCWGSPEHHFSALHLTPSAENTCTFPPSFTTAPLVAQCWGGLLLHSGTSYSACGFHVLGPAHYSRHLKGSSACQESLRVKNGVSKMISPVFHSLCHTLQASQPRSL